MKRCIVLFPSVWSRLASNFSVISEQAGVICVCVCVSLYVHTCVCVCACIYIWCVCMCVYTENNFKRFLILNTTATSRNEHPEFHIFRLAVMLIANQQLCANSHRRRGQYLRDKRHLEILGYRVEEVRQSCYSSCYSGCSKIKGNWTEEATQVLSIGME